MSRTSLQTVILLLLPAIAGLAAGFVMGGRLANIASVSLRALWLLWLAAAVQAAQYYLVVVRELVEKRVGFPMLGVSFGIVMLWLGLNVRRARPALNVAVLAILLGAASNGVVILLNGRMPFSADAARFAGLPPDTVTAKNQPSDEDTRLSFMGDVIPVPPLGKVISPGDILISLGGAAAIAIAMRRRVRSTTESPPVANHGANAAN